MRAAPQSSQGFRAGMGQRSPRVSPGSREETELPSPMLRSTSAPSLPSWQLAGRPSWAPQEARAPLESDSAGDPLSRAPPGLCDCFSGPRACWVLLPGAKVRGKVRVSLSFPPQISPCSVMHPGLVTGSVPGGPPGKSAFPFHLPPSREPCKEVANKVGFDFPCKPTVKYL